MTIEMRKGRHPSHAYSSEPDSNSTIKPKAGGMIN